MSLTDAFKVIVEAAVFIACLVAIYVYLWLAS